MKKVKARNRDFLLYLMIVLLALNLANLYLSFNLYGKINSIADFNEKNFAYTTTTVIAQQPSQGSRIQVSVDNDPVKGQKDAKVTIVEFSDFQCPFCARFFQQTLPQIDRDYIKTGKVKFVYRDFPLSFHQYAQKAAEAAECANEQGKFWQYHDILYGNQSDWSSGGITKLKEYAKKLDLDTKKFDECLDSGKYFQEVQKDFSDGQSYGVSGTPTFFINGIKLVGAQPYETFKKIIEQEL
ncbi:MAG: DsbA family protein [Candidatus Altiarchaeota archaeon]